MCAVCLEDVVSDMRACISYETRCMKSASVSEEVELKTLSTQRYTCMLSHCIVVLVIYSSSYYGPLARHYFGD
jgi:hypothetical protein